MPTNVSNARGGHDRPSHVDDTGESPPPYARVHRDNGRNPNVLQIVSEGDFWTGLAELEPWMPSFGHRVMGPILSELFKRRNKLEAQRNTLDRQLDNLSQMIDWLGFVLHPSEEVIYENSANEHGEQRQQRRGAVQHGEPPHHDQVFEPPAPLRNTGHGVDVQDRSVGDPEIWQLNRWPLVEVSRGNARRG